MNDLRLNTAQRAKLAQSLGAILREARLEQGWSLSDLAERTGVGKAHISRIENGHSLTSLPTLIILCHTLGFSVSSVAQDLGL